MSTSNGDQYQLQHISVGQEIVETLAGARPFHSLSFALTPDGHAAMEGVYDIVEDRMGKNMYKLKEAALDIFKHMLSQPAETPLNVNLSEYEIKAMNAVLDLIERVKRDLVPD